MSPLVSLPESLKESLAESVYHTGKVTIPPQLLQVPSVCLPEVRRCADQTTAQAPDGSGMAATLADVATRAGVSAATVSRVLNGNYPVATRTRERVLRAVQELEYVVNGHARALAAST